MSIPLVQNELVNAYTFGIPNECVGDRIIRTNKQNWEETDKLVDGEREIIDGVDMLRMSCPGCNQRKNHVCWDVVRGNKFTEDGTPICNYCGGIAHLYRNCWARNGKMRPKRSHQQYPDTPDSESNHLSRRAQPILGKNGRHRQLDEGPGGNLSGTKGLPAHGIEHVATSEQSLN